MIDHTPGVGQQRSLGLPGKRAGKGVVHHNVNTIHPGSQPDPAKKKAKARAKRKATKR